MLYLRPLSFSVFVVPRRMYDIFFSSFSPFDVCNNLHFFSLSSCPCFVCPICFFLHISPSLPHTAKHHQQKQQCRSQDFNILKLTGFLSTLLLSFPVLRFTARLFAYIITTRASGLLYRGNRSTTSTVLSSRGVTRRTTQLNPNSRQPHPFPSHHRV